AEALATRRQAPVSIQSYAFLWVPHLLVQDASEGPLARPEYFSMHRRNARLPWYVARPPVTRSGRLERADSPISITPEPEIEPTKKGNISRLSLDLAGAHSYFTT